MPIEYLAHNFKAVSQDEYTGEILPNALVRAALIEDLNYFNKHVWDVVEKRIAYKLDDYKLVRMRWAICNKGDANDYDIRARLVACEINTYKTDEYFASTPPLEAKRLLFSEMARVHKTKDGRDLELLLLTYAKRIFTECPKGCSC